MMKKNLFLIETGFETFLISVMLALQSATFFHETKDHKPIVHFFNVFGSMPVIVMTMILGLVCVFVGFNKSTPQFIKRVVLNLLGGTYSTYFVTFIVQDYYFRGLTLSTVLMGFLLIRILSEAFIEGWYAKSE